MNRVPFTKNEAYLKFDRFDILCFLGLSLVCTAAAFVHYALSLFLLGLAMLSLGIIGARRS